MCVNYFSFPCKCWKIAYQAVEKLCKQAAEKYVKIDFAEAWDWAELHLAKFVVDT